MVPPPVPLRLLVIPDFADSAVTRISSTWRRLRPSYKAAMLIALAFLQLAGGLMASVLKTFLFSAPALRDWGMFLIISSLFETARGWLPALWYRMVDSLFITAVVNVDDISFLWLMHWLSKQPSWKGARNVEISTSNLNLHHAVQIELNGDQNAHSRKVTYLPAILEAYSFWYNYRWIKVTRAVEPHGWYTKESLTIRIMTRNRAVLTNIIQDAKNGYTEAQKDKISIFVSDRYESTFCWRELATRPKRPLNSIILDPGITDLVIEDVRDFLGSKVWYAERGIPFRRGYLLYGAPGSGKTSLIHSIAGELGLSIYIISLSRSGLDDTGLANLISALPERCIALLEDVDAAFHHGLNREFSHTPSTQTSYDPGQQYDTSQTGPPPSADNRVSLSGLLNALDGLAAQEGRVLFATTNKYESLDPALCRPGRMDLHIEFKFASRVQAEELFKRFYAPPLSSSAAHATDRKDEHTAVSEKCENRSVDGSVGVAKEPSPKDLINLSEPRMLPTPSSLSPSSSPRSPCHLLSEESKEGEPSGPTYVGVSHRARAPHLSLDRIHMLAAQFALAVPERQLSMASLQCFLMMHKTRPLNAATEVGTWVEKELAERKEIVKADERNEVDGTGEVEEACV